MNKSFDLQDMEIFQTDAKVGLLGTLNENNKPHITLITTLQAKAPESMIWGAFTEGCSKKHVLQNPRTGFLILTQDRLMWRGKALWTHSRQEGDEFILMNSKPLFRYNSYFGIHTVHYMDLIETYGRESLPMGQIIPAILFSSILKTFMKKSKPAPVFTPWITTLLDGLDTIKCLAYVDESGYPRLMPLLQCRSLDTQHLVFSTLAYHNELSAIPKDQPVAIFALNMKMESILLRGSLHAIQPFATFMSGPISSINSALSIGIIDVSWVYNSMPPIQGQIYPPVAIRPVQNY
ncbi:hypothetical protein MHK_003357 [Candidatus Magnetomorum sp. HK-1]|nr:hypothetical protein MHK_003357 [Candidatus Magnetomorum sp. HK-1]